MNRNTSMAFLIVLLIAALTACRSAPTPDTQATVNAAVAATSTTQASMQATIDAAVKATAAAAPTATPSVVYVTMSEEELAALIDQAVAEAITSTQQCSTATTAATADGTVTQQEVDAIEVYLTDAEQAIAYADELLNAYYGLYGELATETLALLQAIEQDLALLNESLAAINATLQDISALLEQGVALTEQTLAQLNAAAQKASANAAAAQAKAQTWLGTVQTELDKRAANALAVQPGQIAANRQAALLAAFEYVDAVRQALTDNKISPAELAQIAQLGANAAAGLQAQGGPQLQKLAGSINALTAQVARGQWPQAQAGLSEFEAALGARPVRPSRP